MILLKLHEVLSQYKKVYNTIRQKPVNTKNKGYKEFFNSCQRFYKTFKDF